MADSKIDTILKNLSDLCFGTGCAYTSQQEVAEDIRLASTLAHTDAQRSRLSFYSANIGLPEVK